MYTWLHTSGLYSYYNNTQNLKLLLRVSFVEKKNRNNFLENELFKEGFSQVTYLELEGYFSCTEPFPTELIII